jgi:hypothetical protein
MGDGGRVGVVPAVGRVGVVPAVGRVGAVPAVGLVEIVSANVIAPDRVCLVALIGPVRRVGFVGLVVFVGPAGLARLEGVRFFAMSLPSSGWRTVARLLRRGRRVT